MASEHGVRVLYAYGARARRRNPLAVLLDGCLAVLGWCGLVAWGVFMAYLALCWLLWR